MHLFWKFPAGATPLLEVSAVLEVVQPPIVDKLYFWALQASFVSARGADGGAAHTGLQWNPRHPANRAVNWGGYPPAHSNWKKTLEGSESALPDSANDRNTRDFWWDPGVAYRLRIFPSPEQGWRASVTDIASGVETVIRDLYTPGEYLDHVVVWTEWFCECDAPRVAARWSQFWALSAGGRWVQPDSVRVNHPPDHPCTNMAQVAEIEGPGARVLQIMNATGGLPHNSVIAVGGG